MTLPTNIDVTDHAGLDEHDHEGFHDRLHLRHNDVLTPVDSRFGAVGDGSTDDTAALQACIDVVTGASTGVPGATVWLGPHTYRITDTLTMNRQAIRFLGEGVGNATDYSPNPGLASMIKWDGIAGIPMIQVNDSMWNEFSNFILKGHDTNTPSEGIFFEWLTGESTGTNAHQLVNRVHFGHWPWGTPSNSGQMDYGIRFGGDNGNNDEFLIERSKFGHCQTAGVAIDNSQSTWGHVFKCMFDQCAIGVKAGARVVLWYPTFNRSSDVDIEVNGTASVTTYGYGSEHAALGFRNNDNLGNLSVFGGRILCQTEMTGGNWAEFNNLSGTFIFNGFVVSTQITKPKLFVRGNTSSEQGLLSVKDCRGLGSFSDYDVQAGASGGGLLVDVDSNGLRLHELLNGSAVMSTAIPSANDLSTLLAALDGMGLITDTSP